ncbi:MAG: sigma-54-dependent Fis family transcriptional regulator [Bdellovibrionales bacterium]|nr:sigma-54-dependent Fis family transcriptional regulator [Bdellovibrionales bacterium]
MEALKSQTFTNRVFNQDGRLSPSIDVCTDVDSIMQTVTDKRYHQIQLDFDLGKNKDGHEVNALNYISQINEALPLTEILILTKHDRTKLAVECIKAGASDFLSKSSDPIARLDREKSIVKHAISAKKNMTELFRKAHKNPRQTAPFKSRSMQLIEKNLDKLAPNNSTVLILGPTGSGKSYAARRLNEKSRITNNQRTRVFCNENIAAMPENLAEAFLFGAEKGSYTGATNRIIGLFEQAMNGDLFLDEIGELPLNLQVKLLKVIEEKVFRRLGGNTYIKTNARIICATNKDLKLEVKEGRFRADLYARISRFPILLPSLDQRKEDIPSICEEISRVLLPDFFGEKIEQSMIPFESYPNDLIKHFLHRKNPFNIRGLQNDLGRLFVFCFDKQTNKFNFTNWKNVLENNEIEASTKETDISLNQLIAKIAESAGDINYPGLQEVKQQIDQKTIEYVFKKFKPLERRARALGLSNSRTSEILKPLKLSLKEA